MCDQFKLDVVRWEPGIRIAKTQEGFAQVIDGSCRAQKVWRLSRCEAGAAVGLGGSYVKVH